MVVVVPRLQHHNEQVVLEDQVVVVAEMI